VLRASAPGEKEHRLSTHRVNRVKNAEFDADSPWWAVEIVERLEWSRTVTDDELGSAVVRRGACLEGADAPGWLFDADTPRGGAAGYCAVCSVRDECLELELRVLGGQVCGMGGALGEDGRRALYPVWSARCGGGDVR
jgi:WhiB family redox-sensing transcriptional regulator